MAHFGEIFINNKWVDSAGTDSIEVVNPATEAVIARVCRGTADDVDRAVQAAVAAFPSWSETSVEDRAGIFLKMARLMEARSEEITDIIISELGFPRSQVAVGQTAGAVEELEIIAESLGQINFGESIPGNTVIRRVPAGVVGAITAWNAPLRSITAKAGAAIAAGCTVVLKPSEVAPLSAYIFAEITAEAGLPDGVFNLVSGTGQEVGEAISAHPLIEMVSLTGSVGAGRRVAAAAAETMKRVNLELGGKSANIILEDADLHRAVSIGIDDTFRFTGQVCGGLSRMLVPRARLAEVEELAVSKAESFVIGGPDNPDATLGPVVSAVQRERIRTYMRQAVDEGARLLTGGPDVPAGLELGYFVKPTVFTGTNDLRIAREEVFGPVLVIIPYDTEAEAIDIANDSQYGLAGAVWAADADRARAMVKGLRVGRIRVNGAPLNKRAPHGGFKLSGVGREWGRIGVEQFLDYQSVMG